MATRDLAKSIQSVSFMNCSISFTLNLVNEPGNILELSSNFYPQGHMKAMIFNR